MLDNNNIPHFCYENIIANPKTERVYCHSPDSVNEDNQTQYEILHTGGFIKLTGPKGRIYWINQGLAEMKNPDWKLHFAIHKDDIPVAWNIIAHLFIQHNCQFGMKTRLESLIPQHHGDFEHSNKKSNGEDGEEGTHTFNSWSPEMWGREITVYIYQHHSDYDNEDLCSLSKDDERNFQFWNNFASQAEQQLSSAGVRSVRINCGDKKFGNQYVSIRNEAFIKYNPKWTIDQQTCDTRNGILSDIYPPNDAGWNAADHKYPFSSHLSITDTFETKKQTYCSIM